MRKWILLIIVVGVIVAGWFLYFNDGEKVVDVSVCEAEYTDLENTLEFSGEVTPLHMYSVMSASGGKVAAVWVSEGSKVVVGQSLIGLDKTALENQMKQAQLNAQMMSESAAQTVMAQTDALMGAGKELRDEQAKIALALSQTTGYDYESFNNALSPQLSENAAQMAASLGDVSLAEAYGENTPAAAGAAKTEMALANLAVEQLKSAIDDMSLSSLINGTVLAVNINCGEVLMPGVPAMVIADTDNTRIVGYVYERDVSMLSAGTEVRVYTEKGFYLGVIERVSDAVMAVGDMAAFEKMAAIEIVPEDAFDKMPGAVVDIEIVLSEKKDVIALPIDCLTDDGCVYVVDEDGIAEKRSVTTGFEDTFNVEITSGIYAGETVVISPADFEEGQQVVYDRD